MMGRKSPLGTPLQPIIRDITVDDLDELMSIEVQAYSYPWSRGNFVDSIKTGYRAEGLWLLDEYRPQPALVAYCWAMRGVDEMHLLNITVRSDHRHQGLARHLLDRLVAQCAQDELSTLWLEVRESNHTARALYERYGFEQVGGRKGYYPAAHSRREDAVIMKLDLRQALLGDQAHAAGGAARFIPSSFGHADEDANARAATVALNADAPPLRARLHRGDGHALD